MSIEADVMLEKVPTLSVDDLLLIQEHISKELRQRSSPEQNNKSTAVSIESVKRRIQLPHAYRRTAKEIEASLAAMFTPEEIAEIGKRDFKKMVIKGKPLSEMVNENREDRF